MNTRENDLLTRNEVLAILKVSRATLYVFMERDDFPRPVKLGNCNRWPRFEVEGWLEAQPRAQSRVRKEEPAMR